MTQGWDLPRCGSPAQVGEAPGELLVQVLGAPALADLSVCNGYFESVMHWDHFSYRSRKELFLLLLGPGGLTLVQVGGRHGLLLVVVDGVVSL